MGFNKQQLKYFITSVLKEANMYSESAVNLIQGTIAQESGNGTYLHQLGNGPAKGIIQMEPFTEKDIWNNYILYRPHIKGMIYELALVKNPNELHLEGNLIYQIIMCRLHYMRDRQPLPEHNDVLNLAKYWKRVYNTKEGKGTVKEFIVNYEKYVL